MKIVIPVFLGLALCLSAMARTQDTSNQGQSQTGSQATQGQSSSQMDQGKTKDRKMSGKLSKDDKTFTTDSNKTYKVDNPEALKGQEGQHVALIVQVDPDTNTIHIVQIEPPAPQQP